MTMQSREIINQAIIAAVQESGAICLRITGRRLLGARFPEVILALRAHSRP